MPKSAWEQRIRRAEFLADQLSFAAELLRFYVHVAGVQQDHYRWIESATQNSGGISSIADWTGRLLFGRQDDSAIQHLLAHFSQFLAVVEKHGPERLAQVAHELRKAPDSACFDLVNTVWSCAGQAPADPEGFLALTFLQPFAEFMRNHSVLRLEGYTQPICPFCDRKPALGVLRPLGDGAQRKLICGFCLAEWDFRRVICPGCGQEDHAKLPVYTAEIFPHIRVECCDTCQTYIKSVDLAKNGLAVPLVDELAAIPLDLWAQEHGYDKLQLNLFGM